MDEKYKIHAFYIFGILLFLIISLVSIQWSKISDLANLISFAATIASLLLATLTIIYAYLSNASLSSNLFKINEASDNMSIISGKLSLISDEIIERLGSLGEEVRGLPDKIQSAIEEKRTKETKTEKHEKGNINAIVDDYISYISLSGKLLILSIILSFKTKKAFSLQDLASKIGTGTDYAKGFIVASTSVGLFDYTESNEIYNIIKMPPYLEEKIDLIKEKINKTAEDIGKTHGWEDFAPSELKKITTVEEFFK